MARENNSRRGSRTLTGTSGQHLGRNQYRHLVALFVVSLTIPISFFLGSVRLSPYRVVLLLLMIPAAAIVFGQRVDKIRATDVLIVLYAAWGSTAILITSNIEQGLQPSGIFLVESLGSYLIGRAFVNNQASYDAFVRLMAIIVGVMLPLAAYEALTGNAPLIQILRQLAQVATVVDIQNTRFGLHRAEVAFEHPILYGVFTASTLGMFLYGQSAERYSSLNLRATIVAVTAATLSLSAGAFASLVAQVILTLWDRVTKVLSRRWLVFSIILGTIFEIIDLLSNRSPFHVLVSYMTFSPGSSYNRILIWQYGSADALQHPVFGIGMADWSRPAWMGSSIDNLWLLIALRYGLPAFAFLALAIVALVWMSGRRQLRSRRLRAARAGVLVSLGGLVVAAATVDYWNAVYCWLMFVIGSGGWLIGAEDDPKPEVTDSEAIAGPSQDSRMHAKRALAR